MPRGSNFQLISRHALFLCVALLTVSITPTFADEAVYIAPEGRSDAPYSESVIYDDLIFLAGKLGTDPDTGRLVEGGIGPQTAQTLDNIKTALERAGGSMDRVLKCNVFLADIAEWSAMNAVYTQYFGNLPARTAIGNAGLSPGARVEIECIAAAPDDDEDDEDTEAE